MAPSFMPFVKKLNLKAVSIISYFLIGLLLLQTGCFSPSPVEKGSVLILSFANISVDEFGEINSEEPHLEQFLNESIRFTHTYTTSVSDSAALASILTGLYPSENGVHGNGPSRYIEGIVSLPELLGRAKKSSFLLSGGAPILRKSAISRGFNEFDDVVRINGEFYLKAKDLVQKAWPVLESHIGHDRFLGLLYFPDHLFEENISKERKLQILDEAIGILHERLSKLKQWDGLTIILVGLHGSGRTNGLYDDQVHIPLVIKPARKLRDLSPSWKVDSFLSLADLGKTLAKILDVNFKKESEHGVHEFSKALVNTDFFLPSDRVLFSESDILNYNGWGPRLFAVRSGEWVFLPIEKKLFNTYTDRLQTNDIYRKDPGNRDRMEKLWLGAKMDLGDPIPWYSDIYSKLSVAKTAFSHSFTTREKRVAFDDYFNNGGSDLQVIEWQHRFQKDTQKEVSKEAVRGKSKVKVQSQDCEDAAISLNQHDWEKLKASVTRDCRDKETQAWIAAYLSFKYGKVREAPALYELARAFTDKRAEQKELQRFFWLGSAQIDWPPELPSTFPVFESFSGLVKDLEFIEFVKKKPTL